MNRKKNTTSVPTLPQSKINQSLLVPPPQIMSPNQSYSTYIPPEPKFDPNDYITGSTTKRDIILYKEIFDFLDSNNNGVIQPMDLRKAFASAGKYQPKKQIIYQMIADFDQDQSGIIEFREFVRMMSMHPGEKDTDEDFENIFYQFDLDYKGYITIDDLREMASECNENLKDEDLENIIKACDPEGNGTIRKQGFIRYMKSLQKKN
ncbi:unnamed protein product (macronuclear) [Paramecium tetraurelia]|uniref:EF-hand domain-containing protein n=1 Tax=Paramecium tetraurelia TaxID=5888 RepID=A0DZD2_PARTE|nr:uncharacterized protein GSPATT00003368001 [Paramecium tetraurelia]CAK88399.1 unnamed protein product [Paramecium tetraurelia]|eukprot:XP_001455796.1 hypothetical protein (macronuclear) [Paramecium tetraurelia strain d4-2]